jgi:enoyl-CoA hydratase/carnithine racemase
MEMLLLGELLPAREAAEYGLVNRVVPAGRLMGEALALAEAVASKPAATVAIGKEAFYRQIEMGLGDAYDYAAGVMVENMMHADSHEGIGAFIDKRPPVWNRD